MRLNSRRALPVSDGNDGRPQTNVKRQNLTPPSANQNIHNKGDEMSWDQADFNEYMRKIRTVNKHYERFKKSRIHSVTQLLKPKTFTQNQAHIQSIQTAWNNVPEAARAKYRDAWQYVHKKLFRATPGAMTVDEPLPEPKRTIRPPTGAIHGLTEPSAPGVLAAVTLNRRVAQRDTLVNEDVEQWMTYHDNTKLHYKWRAKYRLRFVRGGKQGQYISVIVPLAAYSGAGPAHDRALSTGLTTGVPDDHVGAVLTDQVKRNWTSRIAERWGGAVFLVKDLAGQELEQYDIEFQLDWVDNSSLAAQIIFAVQATGTAPPDGTVNTMYWGVDDGGTTGAAIAHEFGHLLGNPDEYNKVEFRNREVSDNGGIMQDETHGTVKAGHFFMVASYAANELGLDPASCFVRFSGREYHVSNNHPWL